MEIVTEEQKKAVRECVEEFLREMSIEAKVEEGVIGDSIAYIVRTDDAALLIGEDGQNLFALNYMLKRIIEKRFPGIAIQFMLDVNDYRRRRFEELKDQARMSAQRVRYFKKEVVLEPMSAFERRIVHLVLQEYPDIVTESTGQGSGRRVVIRPLYL